MEERQTELAISTRNSGLGLGLSIVPLAIAAFLMWLVAATMKLPPTFTSVLLYMYLLCFLGIFIVTFSRHNLYWWVYVASAEGIACRMVLLGLRIREKRIPASAIEHVGLEDLRQGGLVRGPLFGITVRYSRGRRLLLTGDNVWFRQQRLLEDLRRTLGINPSAASTSAPDQNTR